MWPGSNKKCDTFNFLSHIDVCQRMFVHTNMDVLNNANYLCLLKLELYGFLKTFYFSSPTRWTGP